MHVLCYLKRVPRVMTVRGEIFDEDVFVMAPTGSVQVRAHTVSGGDADRKSTSGVIAWVKEATGKWYLVQSVSRKQTTVSLFSAEAELISMLADV